MANSKCSYTKGSLNRELSRLANNLTMRTKRPKKVGRKMFIWKSTVQFSYKLKRFIDCVAALVGLVVLSPLLIVVADCHVVPWASMPIGTAISHVRSKISLFIKTWF